MENMDTEEPIDKLDDLDEFLMCSICQKDIDPSASASAQGHFLCKSHRSTGQSSANVTTPNPVTVADHRPCQYASEGCYELITSTNHDHETISGYHKTHCKVLGCKKHTLFKDLLQHLHSEHASILFTAEKTYVEWPRLKDGLVQIFPLYVFDTILWEKIHFKDEVMNITFFYESRSKLTPRLLAVVTIHCWTVGMVDTVRVGNEGETTIAETITIPYSKIKIFRALGLCTGCLRAIHPLKIKQGLKIIEDISTLPIA